MSSRPAAFRRGRNAESDVLGPGGLAGQSGLLEQGPEPRRPGIGESGEAFGDDSAVLPEKGHDVADRAQRRDLRKRFFVERKVFPANDRLGDLEGDAGSAEVLEGVTATRLLRVDHGGPLGKDIGRQVMVGDDDGDARLRRLGDRLDGGDAAIDGDDRFRLVLREDLSERFGLEAVAVADAVRKKRDGVGAEGPQNRPELRDRGHSVDVVVAENDDLLAALRRRHENVDRALHSLHPKWVVSLRERRREEISRSRAVANAPVQEKSRGNGRNAGLAGERGTGFLIRFFEDPAGHSTASNQPIERNFL